jgi:hypothetical protein
MPEVVEADVAPDARLCGMAFESTRGRRLGERSAVGWIGEYEVGVERVVASVTTGALAADPAR